YHRKRAPTGEHRNDVLGDPVSEEILFRIAAEIGKRQDGNCPAIVKDRSADGRFNGSGDEFFRQIGQFAGNPVNRDRPADVLEILWAEVFEIEIDLIGDLSLNDLRQIDAARLGQRLHPRCNVYTVAKDVAFLDDDVAEI